MTTYDVTIHADVAEFNKFFEHDNLVSVRVYDMSPYILQDGRRIFRCTLRHPELSVSMERKVFHSIEQLKRYINKYKA